MSATPSAGFGSFRRSFRPELGAAAAARRNLEDLCADVGDDDLLDRGCLALTEAVTNSVTHARLRPSQLIDVEFALRAALLRIEVADDGIGFPPPATSPDRGSFGGGGWGLWMIDQLTDRWGVDFRYSTLVWLEFDRAEPGALPQSD